MTRINTNVPSLIAQNRLRASNVDLQRALTRLSTGLRINSGADDPAGLIASEALRSEITSLGKAISNTQRATQIISTADSALGEVSKLLNDIRGLIVEAANKGALSDEEIAANQLQIDSSLEAINRISQVTTFQGRKLLDGSLSFVSDAQNVTSIRDVKIDQANLGQTGRIDVEVVINTAAQQATVTAGTAAFSAAALANASTAEETQTATISQGVLADIDVTGGPEFTSITFAENGGGAIASTYDPATGVLAVTADFAGGGVSVTALRTHIDGLANFSATGTDAGFYAAGGPATATGSASGNGLIDIAALNTGADYNNVTVEFVAGTANSADYDTTQKVLTVTYDASGSTVGLDDIANAIDTHTTDGAAGPPYLFSATEALAIDVQAAAGFVDVETGTTGGEVLTGDIVFELKGADGAETFNFGSGTSAAQIAAAINLVADSTGVAAAFDATGLVFTSTAYGHNALIAIDVITEEATGTFVDNLSAIRDVGEDIIATVNGIEASANGNTLSINTSTLDLTVTVDDGSSTNFSFSITDGGALFQLGPDVTSNQQARLGIGSLSTGKLGGPSGRLYELGSGQLKSLDNDINGAGQVIDEVIGKVTSLRGRLGAFQRTTLDSNMVSLNATLGNLLEAESTIRDADFARESANLTRAQILVQSGTNVLSLANQNPQNVLALLR